MKKEYVGEMWEQDLPHIEDELHVDCAYCYAIEHGEMLKLPESVCSVHMAWLERKAQSLLVEPKRSQER